MHGHPNARLTQRGRPRGGFVLETCRVSTPRLNCCDNTKSDVVTGDRSHTLLQ